MGCQSEAVPLALHDVSDGPSSQEVIQSLAEVHIFKVYCIVSMVASATGLYESLPEDNCVLGKVMVPSVSVPGMPELMVSSPGVACSP